MMIIITTTLLRKRCQSPMYDYKERQMFIRVAGYGAGPALPPKAGILDCIALSFLSLP